MRFAEDDPAAKPRIFRTPARYLISDVLTGDFTDDGKTDVLLLAWRIGNYGTSHPIWVSGRDITFTEHLFFYQYRKDTLWPLWMSSDVGTHIRAVVFDGEYLHLETAEGGEVLTRWAGWNAPPGVRPPLVCRPAVGGLAPQRHVPLATPPGRTSPVGRHEALFRTRGG